MNSLTKTPQSIASRQTHLRKFIPNIFSDFLDDFQAPGLYSRPLFSDTFEPQIKIDVSERPKEYIIRAEIPGVEKGDIHVSIEGGYINISVQKLSTVEERSSDERIIRSECYYGSSARGIQLPTEIARDNVKANYQNGILHLTLPKANGGTSHEIEIK
jgi:HSP20 family protein